MGELVPWDTSDHAWLEGRGPKLYLIRMIDDACSRLHARFVLHDSTEENMRLLWSYVERHGRPVSFYTDQASLFQTALKSERYSQELSRRERDPMPPTQIGRAPGELDIVWIGAHSPQVVPWWNSTPAVVPASSDDAPRRLGPEHSLAASLSYVEARQISDGYTIPFDNKTYRIARSDIRAGMRGAGVRVEVRLDASLAVRFGSNHVGGDRMRTASQSVKAESR